MAPDVQDPNIEVGTAVRSGPTSFEAGRDAAADALAQVSRHRPSVVLVFASVEHDLGAVLRGVRCIVGEPPLLGATTAGEICGGEHHGSVVVAVLASPFLSVRVGVGEGVSRDWRGALDAALATPDLAPYFDGTPRAWAELERCGRSTFAVMLSPGDTRQAVSRSSDLLEALKRRSLGRLPIFGGSTADDWRMERNFVLCGDRVFPDAVLIAVFETELRFGMGLAHGLRPTSSRATVTDADGHEVLRIDGKLAADVYAALLGTTREALEGRHLTCSTGRVLGTCDQVGTFIPNVASFFTVRGGLLLSRPVSAGTELAVLEVAPDAAGSAGADAIRKARLRGTISRPALALTTYCALRPRLLGDAARSELPRMAEALGAAPIVGFCSFGEQAPSDDGVGQHTNAVIAALVLGQDLSQAARTFRESDRLRHEAESIRRRAREELDLLVAERTADLRAANATLALEIESRRRAEEVAKRHERALRTLGACNEALVRATGEAKLLEDVCRIAVEVGGYRLAWVGSAESDERRTVRPVAVWGHDDGYVASADVVWADTERGRGPVGTAIRTRQPVLARPISADPTFEVWRSRAEKRGFASMIALPLVSEDHVFGALAIYSADLEALGEERELKLLAELADDLAFGIDVLRGRAERAGLEAHLVEADRLAAVGTLAAGVAHEINNPLSYLLGGLEYLEREIAGLAPALPGRLDEAQRVLGEMRAGGARIRHIVRDLKTFSRQDEARVTVDVRWVAESSIHMAAHEIRHRAQLARDFGPVPPVHGSEARLGQVLLNLLVNAAHAISEGSPLTNEVRVTTRTDGSGRAVVEVADTGSGIAPEHLKRIFEPFFTTKPHGVGTGLGLWISRNLVSALGGEIQVESTAGAGTVFRVVLPPAPAHVRAPDPDLPAPRSALRGRVLVVDDDPLVANAIRRTLAPEHDVVVETSARTALARLAGGERYGAIVCDLMMPDMTGMELHAAVARVSPGDGARVVFVTGGAFTPEARQYLETVRNPRLEKPFDPNALLSAVREMVERAT
jgi:signal transduction histidine kinase/CheY-like chemotaxis protein